MLVVSATLQKLNFFFLIFSSTSSKEPGISFKNNAYDLQSSCFSSAQQFIAVLINLIES